MGYYEIGHYRQFLATVGESYPMLNWQGFWVPHVVSLDPKTAKIAADVDEPVRSGEDAVHPVRDSAIRMPPPVFGVAQPLLGDSGWVLAFWRTTDAAGVHSRRQIRVWMGRDNPALRGAEIAAWVEPIFQVSGP